MEGADAGDLAEEEEEEEEVVAVLAVASPSSCFLLALVMLVLLLASDPLPQSTAVNCLDSATVLPLDSFTYLTTYVPFVVGTWSFPLASNDTTPSPCCSKAAPSARLLISLAPSSIEMRTRRSAAECSRGAMNLTLTGALMHASPLRSFRLYSEEECVVVVAAAAVVDEDEDDAARAMVDDVPPLLLLASSSCWLLTLLDVLLLVMPGSAEKEEEGASPSFATPPDMDVVGAENELDVEEEKEGEEEEDSPPPSAWLKACLTFAFQSSSPLSLDDSTGAS